MNEPKRLRELPKDERPRERLLSAGAESLTDAELLAIFIRTGTPGRNAVAIARELLAARNGLRGLRTCKPREIMALAKGIGMAKACELAAAFEIGNRIARAEKARPDMQSPPAVYDLLKYEMRDLRQEVVRVVLLDTRLRAMLVEEISRGTLNETTLHPREVFRPAFVHSAYGIILVHNHPSGDPSPSEADRRMTCQLRDAAEVLSIRLIDHIIIGHEAPGRLPYFSFREAGLL
jgi:DNA repair protein RadC